MKIRITLLLAVTVLLGACADDATETTTPDGGDPATITGVEFLYLESYPVQVRAVVTGELPTPCHVLDTDVAAAENGRIVAIALAVPPTDDEVCAQVVEPFEITLDLGSFESGDYVFELNGTEYPFTI